MKFGLFAEETRRGLGTAAAFEDLVRLAEVAEAWDLDGVWLGEIHFSPTRSVLSAPLVVASALAARTRRIRVGTAVHLLPLGHPLRIAEEVATLDHLCEGRFDFGIGRSGAPRAYDGYGIAYAESQARFREALDIIRHAWKGEPFSYRGEFHRVDDATVSPSPYQMPHPPIRMAASSPETFPAVGRLGLSLFVGLRGMDIPELRGHVQQYRQAWREAGHPGEPSVHLRIPLYAGPTEQAARDEPRESIMYYFSRQADFIRSGARGPDPARAARADQLARLSYAEIRESWVAFGSPAGLVERLARLRDELGLDGIVAEPNPGGLVPLELETRSLRIFAHQVMPALA